MFAIDFPDFLKIYIFFKYRVEFLSQKEYNIIIILRMIKYTLKQSRYFHRSFPKAHSVFLQVSQGKNITEVKL